MRSNQVIFNIKAFRQALASEDLTKDLATKPLKDIVWYTLHSDNFKVVEGWAVVNLPDNKQKGNSQ